MIKKKQTNKQKIQFHKINPIQKLIIKIKKKKKKKKQK